MRRFVMGLLVVLIGAGWIIVDQFGLARAGDAGLDGLLPGSKTVELNKEEMAVVEAVQTAAEAHAESRALYAMYAVTTSNIRIDQSGQWAYAYLALSDPQTGEAPAMEPGLAVLKNIDGVWRASLPGDPDWKNWLTNLPEGLMPPEDVAYWQGVLAMTTCQLPTATYSGFYLPWAYGQSARLTQSTHHDMYSFDTPSQSFPEHYAFDFVSAGGVAMFDVMASRSGTVVKWRDDVATDNNTSSNVNYILIKDSTYNLYHLYLHFAQASIPAELKSVGALVKRGQKVGVADNTGHSTGSHLHFQAEMKPFDWYNCSVDITFNDVFINGGRPRQNGALPDGGYCYAYANDVCSNFQNNYVSLNNPGDADMPTGGFTNVSTGLLITQTNFLVTGWGADISSQFSSAQILAGTGGVLNAVGGTASQASWALDLDVCALNLPNGPVDLGLRLGDSSGNLVNTGVLVTFMKDVTCAPNPPPCVPGAGQAALFADPFYSGACEVFGPGGYLSSDWGSVGPGAASSLLLGSGARVSLFSGDAFSQRAETFYQSDPNLADNRIEDNGAVSLVVDGAGGSLAAPQPFFPANKASLKGEESHSLYWTSTWGDQEFQVRVITATGTVTSTWLTQPGLALSDLGLAPGAYAWQVRSRSPLTVSTWSMTNTFTLTLGTFASSTALNLPLSDTADNEAIWTMSGLWNTTRMTLPNLIFSPVTVSGPYWWAGGVTPSGTNYDYRRASSLTSPPLNLPASPAWLNFLYYYKTETSANDVLLDNPAVWDQRLVQVVLADGRVETLQRFSGDVMGGWKQSPYISLAKYAGQTVRLRFYFETLDGLDGQPGNKNLDTGWLLDNIQVNTDVPGTCTADAFEGGSGNDTPSLAYSLSGPVQTLYNGRVCPFDVDYFRFDGKAGDFLQLSTDTYQTATHLDSVIALLASDGRSVLAYNDDYGGRRDSFIQTVLPEDGTYYVRVQGYSYPNVYWTTPVDNGQARVYDLHFKLDTGRPVIRDFKPLAGTQYPQTPIQVSALITPTAAGLAGVEFFWHSGNWTDPVWHSLGAGVKNGNRYSVAVDAATIGSQQGAAFYVRATSNAATNSAAGAFQINVDGSAPSVTLNQPAATQASNAYWMSWSGSDALAGMGTFLLDRKLAGGAWSPVLTQTLMTSLWELMPPGSTYVYRLAGRDLAGNLSAYQVVTTTVPAANVLCAAPDAFEPDNSLAQAHPLVVGLPQTHNFCNPANPGFNGDVEWLTATVQSGRVYAFSASLPGQLTPAAPVLRLYAVNGVDLLAEAVPGAFPGSNLLVWQADRDGVVALKVENLEPNALAGAYSLNLVEVFARQFLPALINHKP